MKTLGEKILDHYEEFLGDYIDSDRYTNQKYGMQLLGFDKTFQESITFATFGLSNYSHLINNVCEVIMAVDKDYDDCATVMMNALFYIVQEQMNFGRGTLIEGVDNIIKDFSLKHDKSALYFTEVYILPESFSKIDNECKMYMAFFVSDNEAKYIKESGCEKFEDLLEEKNVDVINIDRISVV